MRVPDEPAHVRRAAGLVRGQLLGATSTERAGRREYFVRIPESIGVLGACVTDDFPPECPAMRARGRGDVSVMVESRLARYNPAYYAVVGLPTLVQPGRRTVLAMRMVTVVLVALLITLGVSALFDAPGASRWTIAGFAAAVTPMVLFLTGSVNPNAVEIAAGIGLWLALLAWFSVDRAQHDARHAVRAALLGATLVSTRALAPLLLVLIVVGAAGASPRHAVAAVVRRRAFLSAASVVTAASVVAVGWTLGAGTLERPDKAFPQYDNLRRYLFDVLNTLSGYERQMIGAFGWLDTPAQDHVYIAWFAVLGFLVLGAFAVGPTRIRLVLVLLLFASAVIPVVVQLPGATEFGLIWQGRYLLPLMVGLPLVAGAALSASPGWSSLFSGSFPLATVLALLGLAHVSSFWWALHRNVIGLNEHWIGFTPLWEPPLGWIPLVLLYTAAMALWLAVVWRIAGRLDVSAGALKPGSVDAAAHERP